MSDFPIDSKNEVTAHYSDIRSQQSPCDSEATVKQVMPYLADCLVGEDVISHCLFYDIRAANGERIEALILISGDSFI